MGKTRILIISETTIARRDVVLEAHLETDNFDALGYTQLGKAVKSALSQEANRYARAFAAEDEASRQEAGFSKASDTVERLNAAALKGDEAIKAREMATANNINEGLPSHSLERNTMRRRPTHEVINDMVPASKDRIPADEDPNARIASVPFGSPLAPSQPYKGLADSNGDRVETPLSDKAAVLATSGNTTTEISPAVAEVLTPKPETPAEPDLAKLSAETPKEEAKPEPVKEEKPVYTPGKRGK